MKETWSSESYDLLPRLAKVTVPTLVITGDHDFFPVSMAEEICGRFPPPDWSSSRAADTSPISSVRPRFASGSTTSSAGRRRRSLPPSSDEGPRSTPGPDRSTAPVALCRHERRAHGSPHRVDQDRNQAEGPHQAASAPEARAADVDPRPPGEEDTEGRNVPRPPRAAGESKRQGRGHENCAAHEEYRERQSVERVVSRTDLVKRVDERNPFGPSPRLSPAVFAEAPAAARGCSSRGDPGPGPEETVWPLPRQATDPRRAAS